MLPYLIETFNTKGCDYGRNIKLRIISETGRLKNRDAGVVRCDSPFGYARTRPDIMTAHERISRSRMAVNEAKMNILEKENN
ncbi:unnamed protein product, partial [Iphiclides podalirius]